MKSACELGMELWKTVALLRRSGLPPREALGMLRQQLADHEQANHFDEAWRNCESPDSLADL